MNRTRHALRLLVAAVLAVLAVGAIPTVAHAGTVNAPLTVAGDSITITSPAWKIATGVVLPFLIALVLKASADPRFKAVVGVVVAAVAAIAQRAILLPDGGHLIETGMLLDVALVYAPQLLSYLGVWREFNINDRLLPHRGMG